MRVAWCSDQAARTLTIPNLALLTTNQPRRPAPIPIPSHISHNGQEQFDNHHSPSFSPRSATSSAFTLPLASPATPTARWSVTQRLFPYFSNWASPPIPTAKFEPVPTGSPAAVIYNPDQTFITPRLPATRLWNPQNSSPRTFHSSHSNPTTTAIASRPETAETRQSRDEGPLLTFEEQRRNRESLASGPGSALGLGIREDWDPRHLTIGGQSGDNSSRSSIGLPVTRQRSAVDHIRFAQTEHRGSPWSEPPPSAMALRGEKDEEMGSIGQNHNRIQRTSSRVSLPPSLHDHQQDGPVEEEEYPWGPSHPCFPHLNPHVPLQSPLYASTRVIRVRRDWMQAGDSAPTFANLYPEVLDPLVTEDEFRRLVKHINAELISAFNPYSARNFLDSFLAVATLWLWEDLGLSGAKSKLRRLENWIEKWNHTTGKREGVSIVPLRRTGYMNVSCDLALFDRIVRMLICPL